MSVPAYPAYQDTGVEWIGRIPTGWEIRRFRFVFSECGDKIDGEVFGEMLSVSGYRGIEIKAYDDDNRRRLEDELQGYRIVRRGQLVINTMWMNYAGLGVSEFDGHVSPAYRAFDISGHINARYAHHLLRSEQYVKGYTSYLTGIRPNSLQMSRDDLFNLPVLLPPPAEQSAIAAFLDRETGKIDALVAEQERLIALLKEKRQAVISQAVTKGLDPNAPMKDSGIEWLGQVPAHWGVRRVKDVARLESGHTPSKQFPEYWDGGDIAWVSLNDSKHLAVNDFISETAFKITAAGLANSSARLLPSGSVVFTRDATIGLAAITTREMAVSQHLIAWCPSSAITSLFLLRVFNVMKAFLDGYTAGATIKTIGMPEVRKLVTPVPPVEEQDAIVAFIATEAAKVDALTTEAERAIALLKERRAALISAAVTGQIDVRRLVVPAEAQAA